MHAGDNRDRVEKKFLDARANGPGVEAIPGGVFIRKRRQEGRATVQVPTTRRLHRELLLVRRRRVAVGDLDRGSSISA